MTVNLEKLHTIFQESIIKKNILTNSYILYKDKIDHKSDISFKEKSLVVGTSNKSELLLGYGTIFGDIACAINPIGEIYKSDEFEFAKLLGVPESILTKAPSADLWEGQSDEDELGHTYKEIDDLLKLMVDDKKSKDELLKLGFEASFIDKINNRMKANAFKGKLPTIAKLGEYL